MFFSEYLDMDYQLLERAGVFDPILEKDSAFFINVLRLKRTNIAEFKNSYSDINDFFSDIASIIENASEKDVSDKFYRAALKKFSFSEVNGINLGFSDSRRGSGMGDMLRKQIIDDAYDLVKRGCKAPELFHLIGLFEDGIGPDRLSDMIATIILPHINNYTKRIMDEFDITEKRYIELNFTEDGLLVNPYKNCPIYLLPIEILHELPVAKCWEDIESVASKNETIRNEMNIEISDVWQKWASSKKKSYIRNRLLKEPDSFARIIDAYRKEDMELYNVYRDSEYYVQKLFQKIKNNMAFNLTETGEISSLEGAKGIIKIFKDWVENNKGWDEIQKSDTKCREKSVQRFVHGCAKYYIEVNDLDLSCEADEGPGPEDFKISRGQDCTVVELKLSTNKDYMHGYEEQIRKYAKAENTENMIFIFVDIGNPKRRETIIKKNKKDIKESKLVPELIIIDACRRKSASKKDL